MYDILKRKNQALQADVLGFAQKLVQTPSLSLQEAELANLIQQELKKLAYDKVITDEAGNVLGIMLGRENAPTVMLLCHMDTMPVGAEKAWRQNPFSGEIKDGRLHGLGAGDCKGGLAAQLYVAALLKRTLLPLKGNLIFAATVAQEKGGSAGVRALVEKTLPKLGLKPDYALLGEPTDLGLYYGHDGWMELEIRLEGRNLFSVDDAARAVFQNLSSESNQADEQPEHSNARPPRFDEQAGLRRAVIDMNRRLGQGEDPEFVLTQLQQQTKLLAESAGEVAVSVQVRQENQRLYTGATTIVRHLTHAWAIDPFHPLMERARQTLAAAGAAVRPGKWQLGLLGMGTAGGVLARDYGIPAIGYGPGNEQYIHAPNEYVETARVVECVYGTASIVHGLIGVPVFGWTSDDI